MWLVIPGSFSGQSSDLHITKQTTVHHLQNDSADELDTLDDGVLGPGYRHSSLSGVGKEVSCYLYLCPRGLFKMTMGNMMCERVRRGLVNLL
jgi:hypothetical protein